LLHSSIAQVPSYVYGWVYGPVQELEAQPLGPRLFQEPSCLCAQLVDVGPEPCHFLQFLLGRRQRGIRKDGTADRVHDSDLGELRRAMPVVDRQGQGPADPHVVEWLFLVVGCDKVTAIPVVSLHGDLVAQCVDELGREKGISQENLAREAGVTRRSRQTLLFDFDY
jgi:hypothetical protein